RVGVGPDRQRRRGRALTQSRPAGASPALLVAAAGQRRAAGVQGVLPVHAVRGGQRAAGSRDEGLRHRIRALRPDGFRRAGRSGHYLAAESGWALYELPARHTVRTDAEALDACARLAARLVRREATVFDPAYADGR